MTTTYSIDGPGKLIQSIKLGFNCNSKELSRDDVHKYAESTKFRVSTIHKNGNHKRVEFFKDDLISGVFKQSWLRYHIDSRFPVSKQVSAPIIESLLFQVARPIIIDTRDANTPIEARHDAFQVVFVQGGIEQLSYELKLNDYVFLSEGGLRISWGLYQNDLKQTLNYTRGVLLRGVDWKAIQERDDKALAERKAELDELKSLTDEQLSEKRRLEEEEKHRRIEKTRILNMRRFVEKAIDARSVRDEKTAKSLEASIEQAVNDLNTKRRQLANYELSKNKEESIKTFMDDFHKIKDSSKVEQVSVNGQTLTIDTVPIIAKPRGLKQKYNLGKIRITLGFGDSVKAEASSLEYHRALPHTSGNSDRICLGNIETEICNYLSRYEIVAAFSMIISLYERGIDPSDPWGRKVKNFPEVKT